MSEQTQPLILAILNRIDLGQMNCEDLVHAADLVAQCGVSRAPLREAHRI